MSTKKNSSYGLISLIDEKINTYENTAKLDGYRIFSNGTAEIFGSVDIIDLFTDLPNIPSNSIVKLADTTMCPSTALIKLPFNITKLLYYSLTTQVLHQYEQTSYNKHGYVMFPEICESKVNTKLSTINVTLFFNSSLIFKWKTNKPTISGWYLNYYFNCTL